MRRLLILVSLLAVGGVAAVLYFGGLLAAPSRQEVGEPPADLPVKAVSLGGENQQSLKGWFVAGQQGHGVILLFHGVRADRRSMIGRARFLHKAGYSVLMIDFQSHGESSGTHITFGYLESRNAITAVRYIKDKFPEERLGVIGLSLGAAASVVGKEPLPVDALVLEAVYSSLDRAVENRLVVRFGPVGRYLAPLLLWQVRPRLGFDPDALSPVDHVSGVTAPVLIIAGGDDNRTTLKESRAIFDNAPEPKALWVIEQARHQDFHRFAPDQYEHRLLDFLNRYVRQATAP